jgi:hypothetical protein
MKLRGLVVLVVWLPGCVTTNAPVSTDEVPCEVTEAVMSQVRYVEGADACAPYAIGIRGAPCTKVGVAAEHRWLAEHFPGYRVTQQSLESTVVGSLCPPTSYDAISIELPSGDTKTVTFEINEFYGK